ncbi:MAG: protein translocase subunit SecD [Chloroflexia bacterium]|nr:protein translocase subunit SecD [Chloroflexia bacterium]
MKFKPVYTLAIIAILTVMSVWITLPTGTLDFGGWKTNNEIYIHQGLDLQGGLQVVLEARPPEGQSVDTDALQGTRDTIERRVNELGVSEPLIQTRGDNQIVVELPGVGDPEAAIEVVQATALLEFIDPQGAFLPPGTRVNTELGPADAVGTGEPATGENPPTYRTVISGADLSDAYPATDAIGTRVVGFEISGSAASTLFEFTSSNVTRPMSIVVDKVVISSPQINQPISGSGQISGMNTEEVSDLAVQLKSGALETPLEVVQSRTVGPTLGQDSIDKSIVAGIVGLGLVAIMMVLYYRVPGVVSIAALLIYTTFVFSLFKLIPVTLTLAGIAGFILSIGMAVDANVLIFARLKEELRRGRSVAAAVEDGFRHAWPSIRDSNIATMITCVILYWFGQWTGASLIQGFALTLFIGVAMSMFTAVVVTRTFMRLLLGMRWFQDHWWLGVERTRPSASVAD